MILTPYYDPSPPLWELVANSMSYFWHVPEPPEGIVSSEQYVAYIQQVYHW